MSSRRDYILITLETRFDSKNRNIYSMIYSMVLIYIEKSSCMDLFDL